MSDIAKLFNLAIIVKNYCHNFTQDLTTERSRRRRRTTQKLTSKEIHVIGTMVWMHLGMASINL